MKTSRLLFTSMLALGLCAALVPSAGFAESITHAASIPLGSTNWNQTIVIPKYDLNPACLDSICFSLGGHVEGLAKFESLDAAPATVTMNLQATITLQRPDLSTLVTVIPLAQTSDFVTAFDGSIDFGGTSGKTYSGLSGDATESNCVTDPADLALFTGTGTIVLPAKAIGTSTGSGAGNLILQFNTSASAQANVTYWYHCPSPTEESSWGAIKSLYR